MENSIFIGRGWEFPPAFGPKGSSVGMVEGELEIQQSLQILFSTRMNERVLHHNFGNSIDDFVFADIDESMVTNLKKMLQDAVEKYEPRIHLVRVDVVAEEEDQGSIQLEVEFKIKGTNTRHNLVYPFSLAEGSLYESIVSR